MTDPAEPIEEDVRRSRRSREAIYRQIMNESEEKPNVSPSKGALKGRSIRHVKSTDETADELFKRVARKHSR
jgi:hypothetical protein